MQVARSVRTQTPIGGPKAANEAPKSDHEKTSGGGIEVSAQSKALVKNGQGHASAASATPNAEVSLRASSSSTAEAKKAAVALQQLARSAPEAAVARMLEDYPQIGILSDAKTFGGNGSEVKRTSKSMLNLLRFSNRDYRGLAGEHLHNAETSKMLIGGFRTLCDQVEHGITELGAGDSELGLSRMLAILSIHDLAKSDAVDQIAKERLNISDHDMAMPALVESNFELLEGVLTDDQVASLRSAVADPAVRAFFQKPRAIAGFNAGRHIQGEAPKNLFLETVRGIGAVEIAEFIADWSGIDGHSNGPTSPCFLANIAPAVNGTAKSLSSLLEVGSGSRTPDELTKAWEQFSYPADELGKLGLNLSSDQDRALTRLAFMGREHQVSDISEAKANVAALKKAFSGLPSDMSDQIVVELNRGDLDLGFTPHTMTAMKDDSGLSTEQCYDVFLRTLQRTIEQMRVQKIDQPVITANLNTKAAGTTLVDAVKAAVASGQSTPAGIVSQIDLEVTRDDKNVLSIDFKARSAATDPLATIQSRSLASLKGQTFLIGGMGGGGDVLQGGAAAMLLEAHGKDVPALFSVRRGAAEDAMSKLGNAKLVDAEHGIIELEADVEGSIGSTNRLPERGVAKSRNKAVFLLMDNDFGASLDKKIERLAELIEAKTGSKIDSVVGVDTGGDALEPMASGQRNDSISTPDQDHTSLKALEKTPFNTTLMVFGLGIDSPADYPEILKGADAGIHRFSDEEKDGLRAFYGKTGLGEDSSVFSRTSLVMKNIIEGETSDGHQFISGIPLDKRTSTKNPWIANIPIGSQMGAVAMMNTKDLIEMSRST